METSAALQYLNTFLDYEKLGYKDMEAFRLERIRALLGCFAHPEEGFPALHVAGTKGKGSTAAFLAGILEEAGFKVGLYTSPHLISLRERIRFNGEMIKEEELAHQAGEIKNVLEKADLKFAPTFFEIYTALAFNYFRAKRIDFGVIETGLGGRLDATNVVKTAVSVITPVSFDHQEILGERLGDIAREKSGIIKKNSYCVSAPQEDEAISVIREKCAACDVPLALVGKDILFDEIHHDIEREVFGVRGILGEYTPCVTSLLGSHQIVNASTAIGAIESLKKSGVSVPEEAIKKGIEKTRNSARCQIIERNPLLVLDGAQNRSSAASLRTTITRNFVYDKLILVLGVLKGKDIKGISDELAGLADRIILTRAKNERSEDPEKLAKFVKGKDVKKTHSVREAVLEARANAKINDLILVAGSFYVAGEAMEVRLSKSDFDNLRSEG